MRPPLADETGRVSATLPLRYMMAAVVAFLLAVAGVVWLAPDLAGHYYHPRIIALTHTVTLGWITLTIMGATYQLIPIVLERPVWSERLARWQFLVLLVGIGGMVAHLYLSTWPGLAMAAGIAGIGVALHLVNVGLSMRGLAAWTFTARLMALAMIGLAATVVFGLGLAAGRLWNMLPGELFPTIHAHFHLAMAGWIAPMVMGVAARVYPMFLLAHEPRGWPGALQVWGLALGVPALTMGLLALPVLVIPGAVALAVTVVGHITWLWIMAAGRKRPRLDWGLRLMLTGAALLLPATALGLALATGLASNPRTAMAYVVLLLGGWISLTVAGMLLKIVPFLVWYRVYSPLVGRAPIPALAHLSWPAGEACAYTLLTAGMIALAVAAGVGDALWIRVAGSVLTLGAVALTLTLARVLRHLAPRGSGRRWTAAVGTSAR
jgi:hypothetical protein